MPKPLELMPHQIEAVAKLGNGKILVGDVGSGKTLAAVAYYREHESPRDIYVITTAKKRDDLDWESEFTKLGVWKETDSTLAGVLTVDSWNSIGKYVDVENAFFIFDEQRLVGSGAWTKAFYKIAKKNHWIMLSATPGDTWLDYIPVMVANGFYKNRTEFKRRHVVYVPNVKWPKVSRYLESGVLVRRRNAIQVIMPYQRHTTRHIHNVEVSYDQPLVRQVMVDRWNIFLDKPMKDIADLFRVTRKIVNTDQSRLNTVRTLLAKHPRLIVFYNFDYELELLRTLVSSTQRTSSEGLNNNGCLDSQLQPSTSTPSSTGSQTPSKPGSIPSRHSPNYAACDECNPTNNEPCDPIVHGREAVWKRERLSSLVSSSSPTSSMQSRAIAESSSAGSTANTASSQTQSSFIHFREAGSTSSQSQTPNDVSKASGLATSPSSERTQSGSTPVTSQSTKTGQSHRTLTLAEYNGHRHDPVPETNHWVYLVQYTAGAEGWNCITTDAMVFYSLPYSYKLWHQAHGRIDRLNTSFFDLHYYVLESKSWIDLAIRKSLRAKKSFNEASWGRKAA